MLANFHNALTEAATWLAFTLSGVKYGPSHLQQLKDQRCREAQGAPHA